MRAVSDFHWAQDAVDNLSHKERRASQETQACERRLRQMQARREKQQRKAALDAAIDEAKK